MHPEIEKARGEIKNAELRLVEKMEAGKHEMLKRLIGLLATQGATRGNLRLSEIKFIH